MFKDSLQKKLQEMERESPSPSLKGVKPTLSEGEGFLARYFSGAVEQVPQKSFVEYTLRDLLYDSRTAWIESYAKDFAKEEGINIQAEHYKKAVKELGNAFLVDESDTSLKNLFGRLKMIANRGKSGNGMEGYSKDVFYGMSPDGSLYSVECQTRIGGDEVSVNIGDIRFRISDESFLNSERKPGKDGLSHYGNEIPKDILTQLLDGRVDNKRMTRDSFSSLPNYDERTEELTIGLGGAALGMMIAGPIGAIVGASLVDECYQRKHSRMTERKREHRRSFSSSRIRDTSNRDYFFAPFWKKDEILHQLPPREAAWKAKHDTSLPFWVREKYTSPSN